MASTKSSIQYPFDPKYRPFLDSTIFFTKFAAGCTLVVFLISNIYVKLQITSLEWYYVPLLISLAHALVYYPWGFVLFSLYDNDYLEAWKIPRQRKVAKQAMAWDLYGTVEAETIGVILNFCYFGIAYMYGGMKFESSLVPVIEFGLKDLGELFVWYMFCIWWADLTFYAFHVWFHSNTWAYKNIHKKHHSFQYQVGWSAEVKTYKEVILVTTVDFLPHLLTGHTVHILAWIIISVLYNIEAHSGYGLFFIKQCGFHDWHHAMNTGNFGLAFYLDHLFETSKRWVDWIENYKSKKHCD